MTYGAFIISCLFGAIWCLFMRIGCTVGESTFAVFRFKKSSNLTCHPYPSKDYGELIWLWYPWLSLLTLCPRYMLWFTLHRGDLRKVTILFQRSQSSSSVFLMEWLLSSYSWRQTDWPKSSERATSAKSRGRWWSTTGQSSSSLQPRSCWPCSSHSRPTQWIVYYWHSH